jgi:hypothetical protein
MGEVAHVSARRVVFLDIDGVLTHFGSGEELDPAAIGHLDQLLDRTCADLILISSWRDAYGLAETDRRLANAGLRHRLAGAVPALPNGSRADEIAAWLATTPDVRFLILDDVRLGPRFDHRCILVDDFVGLTAADVATAARLLTADPAGATLAVHVEEEGK